MANWLVNQKDRQFAARDLEELKQLARDSKVGRGDLIQPPGATDWLYAVELPELAGLLKAGPKDEDDDEVVTVGSSTPLIVLSVIFILIAIAGGAATYHFSSKTKAVNLDLFSDLALTELLVTAESAPVLAEPQAGSATVGSVAKNDMVQLLSKRGAFYRIETSAGVQGWVGVDGVVPGYAFADAETRKDYDPLFNPDRYVFVRNAGWMLLPDQKKRNVTVFNFQMQNSSKFDMENIVLNATIKDKNGKVLEAKEIRIEGRVNRYESTMVGTLAPDPKDKAGERRLLTSTSFADLAQVDPDLQLRWSEGIEVVMDTEGFEVANIDLLEVRAVPKKIN
jgi:hypothetical protein